MQSTIFSLLTIATMLVPAGSLGWSARQGFSQAGLQDGSSDPRPASAMAEFDKLRIEGFDALYNLDYETARQRFKRMIEVAPDHPAGYVCLANNLWLETLNAGKRLSSSLYSSASFYDQDKDSDAVDPKRDKEFNAYIKRAIEVSTVRLRKNSKDEDALYYQGGALGLRAGYGASVARSFSRAIGDANESVGIQKEVIKIDPNYADAYLTLGFYSYVIDNLPGKWKWLVRLAGLKGSKAKGIEQLEMVVQKGKYASDDARVVLMGIYTREGKFDRAAQIASELAEKYPRNYLFRIERAGLLFRQDHRDEAEAVMASILKDDKAAQAATDLVHAQWGEALLRAGDYPAAIEHFTAVKRWPKSDSGLVSLAYLNTGIALDATSKRSDATAEYQAVLKRDNVYDSHKRATLYLKTPYSPTLKK
jgi:tetratricopeptide (TPR) repeat protein